jgi:predicted ATPase
MRTAEHFFVITGGPGSGKSTLIEGLAAAGFEVAPEAGRAVIKEQVAAGGRALPWADTLLFAEEMLRRDLGTYESKLTHKGPVYFDRGIPDVIGYLCLIGQPIPSAMHKAAAANRYNRRVFIAPHWPEIFARDSERKQTLEEAKRTYTAMVATYTTCGYELVELPRVPVAARVEFVRTFTERRRFTGTFSD